MICCEKIRSASSVGIKDSDFCEAQQRVLLSSTSYSIQILDLDPQRIVLQTVDICTPRHRAFNPDFKIYIVDMY